MKLSVRLHVRFRQHVSTQHGVLPNSFLFTLLPS